MSKFINIISKIFGNKYDKDIKAIRPIVEKINEEYIKLSNINHDELRNQTSLFKEQIKSSVSDVDDEI